MTAELRSESAFVATRNGRIEFCANDDPIGRSLAQYGEWAEFEIQSLCAFIGLGSSVVDVGANVGTHTVAFARRVGLTGSVLAFEPQRTVFEMLERNLAASGCTNVRAVQAGVGSAAGEMMVPPVDYLGHTNVGGVQLLSTADGQAGERVPIVALDGCRLSACHLVKVDSEGMEADVLAGMTATIERLRPVVAIECSSVEDGAANLRANKWTDYKIFLFRMAAFNPANFKRNSDNFLGVAHESSLLFVPDESVGHVPASRPGAELIPIADLDDLAIAVLGTPRFGDETAYDRNPSQLRDILARIVRENTDRLRTVDAELKAAREMAAREISRVEFRAASLTQQLRRAEERLAAAESSAGGVMAEQQRARTAASALEAALKLVAERDQEIRALRNSTSWRLTAPLRRLKATLLRPRMLPAPERFRDG